MDDEIEPVPYLFSIAAGPKGNSLSIHMDADGISFLEGVLAQLKQALEANNCDHTHLNTTEYGGWQLTATMLDSEKAEGYHTIHDVTVFAWTDELKKYHKLGDA